MFCGNCGEAEQDGKFCSNCGFQNRGKIEVRKTSGNLQSQQKLSSPGESSQPGKLTIWGIIGAVFGATWVFAGIGVLSDPNCNSVLPAGGSRYAFTFACSSSGEGGQGAGAMMLIFGVAIVVFSLRRLLFKNKP